MGGYEVVLVETASGAFVILEVGPCDNTLRTVVLRSTAWPSAETDEALECYEARKDEVLAKDEFIE